MRRTSISSHVPMLSRYRTLPLPAPAHTARIICAGTIYIKNERPPRYSAWKEVDEITAESFFREGDSVNIQK